MKTITEKQTITWNIPQELIDSRVELPDGSKKKIPFPVWVAIFLPENAYQALKSRFGQGAHTYFAYLRPDFKQTPSGMPKMPQEDMLAILNQSPPQRPLSGRLFEGTIEGLPYKISVDFSDVKQEKDERSIKDALRKLSTFDDLFSLERARDQGLEVETINADKGKGLVYRGGHDGVLPPGTFIPGDGCLQRNLPSQERDLDAVDFHGLRLTGGKKEGEGIWFYINHEGGATNVTPCYLTFPDPINGIRLWPLMFMMVTESCVSGEELVWNYGTLHPMANSQIAQWKKPIVQYKEAYTKIMLCHPLIALYRFLLHRDLRSFNPLTLIRRVVEDDQEFKGILASWKQPWLYWLCERAEKGKVVELYENEGFRRAYLNAIESTEEPFTLQKACEVIEHFYFEEMYKPNLDLCETKCSERQVALAHNRTYLPMFAEWIKEIEDIKVKEEEQQTHPAEPKISKQFAQLSQAFQQLRLEKCSGAIKDLDPEGKVTTIGRVAELLKGHIKKVEGELALFKDAMLFYKQRLDSLSSKVALAPEGASGGGAVAASSLVAGEKAGADCSSNQLEEGPEEASMAVIRSWGEGGDWCTLQ
jgi:hypothetical protein